MEEESESMEEYEKYLQEARFIMKNNKYFYKESNNNINNNFLGKNSNDNINIFSSVATASFNNNAINSINNKNYLSNSIDENKINNLQINNELPIKSPTNNNIKGSVISMKDNFLSKSSSLKIKDSKNIEDNIFNNKIINENINNNININYIQNNNINIKNLKEEISKLKFQIKINQQKFINYEKIYTKLKNIQKENDLKNKKLYLDYNNQVKDLTEKYNQKKEIIYHKYKNKDKEYDKKINILKTKLGNLKENNYYLRKKLSNINEENNELDQINNIKEYELREKLIYQENEINEIKNNINNLKQNYSIIEEDNKNKIIFLFDKINQEKTFLNNIKNNLSQNKFYKPKHQKNLSTIYNNKINISEINENQKVLSKDLNKYDLYKIKDFREKIKNFEKEIVDLNHEISKKSERNERLVEEINKLRYILENSNNKILKNDMINDKSNDKTVCDLELMMNQYENDYNNIIKEYNLRMIEQNDEKNKMVTNYELKIKNLIKKIKMLNYEIYN